MNRTSIIILTHNLMMLTRLCLDSIRRNTDEPYEIIVVDNGSSDDTVSYLLGQPDITLIRNEQNLGFAKGCNQGLAAATGDTILFLNNDTIVTPGWLSRMLRSLYSHDHIGMVGPVSNHVSGHQQIDVHYKSLDEINDFSARHGAQFAGVSMDTRRVVGFCMLVKREVLEEVGNFDEQYGLGNYEDDDLCLRVIYSGYRIRIVYDSFIHHFGHMTMATLQDSSLSELLVLNREKASQKWGSEIHELLYKEAATLTIVVPLRDRTVASHFQNMIHSVGLIADEWIVIDYRGDGEEKAPPLNSSKPIKLLQMKSEEELLWPHICSTITQQYLLWISPEEIITDLDVRRIYGLKIQMDDTIDGVSVLFEQGGGLSIVRRVRIVRRETEFDWNATTQEFVMRPSAVVRKGDITVRSQRPLAL